ncbi:alpha/beta hydrolase-fold protein [Halomonas denitrificans]|nr:hypothetical protein [Halomonas denitrificans]
MVRHRLHAGCAAALLLLAAACARPVAEDATKPDPLFGLGDREIFTVTAEQLQRDFHVLVRLPRSYRESDRAYPMVFLLDGGILFPMLSPFQLMMEAERSAGEVIVVGISYGGLGYSNGNLRGTDYTAPSDEVEYFGGVHAYQDFLADELLPRLQRDYRIDPARRVLLGQSLGGQFAIHAALTRPELFTTYVAVNPAIHANPAYFMDLETVRGDPPTRLVLAIGSEDDPRYSGPAAEWIDARQESDDPGLELEVLPLPGAHHATSAPRAYFDVVRRIAPPEEATPES